MNTDSLLAIYDRVADAPDATTRLRRFVLELAACGKLVEQDPTDEPASELLKRITMEKARFVNAAKIKEKPKSSRPSAVPPFALPQSWEWAPLGKIFLYDAGIKRAPRELDPSFWLLELEDIEKETGRLLARVYARDRKSKSTKSEFQEGDILYGKLRPYLNKVLIADNAGYSTTEIVAIRPFAELNPQYCALILRRPDFVDYVTRLGQGTKMPRLRREDAVNAPFPLAPVAEQDRIVAKVDELMTLCDRMERVHTAREAIRSRVTKATLAHLSAPKAQVATFRSHARFAINSLPALTARTYQIKNLRQTILDLAVRGRLVEQVPEEEPASELLCRITAEKRDYSSNGGRHKDNSKGFSNTTPKISIPQTWEWLTLRDLSLRLHYGYTAQANPKLTDVRLLRITDIQANSVDWPKVPGCEVKKHLLPNYLLAHGDILIARTGGTIGKTFLVSDVPVASVFASYLIRLRPARSVFNQYIKLFCESDLYWSQLRKGARGGAQPNVNGKTLGRMFVPIPPLAEQRRIVAKADSLMTLSNYLEASLSDMNTIRGRLLESVLRAALKG